MQWSPAHIVKQKTSNWLSTNTAAYYFLFFRDFAQWLNEKRAAMYQKYAQQSQANVEEVQQKRAELEARHNGRSLRKLVRHLDALRYDCYLLHDGVGHPAGFTADGDVAAFKRRRSV